MIWHNEEAGQLAQRLKNIIKVWDKGAICPNEFLLQLEDAVSDARQEKNTRANSTTNPNS